MVDAGGLEHLKGITRQVHLSRDTPFNTCLQAIKLATKRDTGQRDVKFVVGAIFQVIANELGSISTLGSIRGCKGKTPKNATLARLSGFNSPIAYFSLKVGEKVGAATPTIYVTQGDSLPSLTLHSQGKRL